MLTGEMSCRGNKIGDEGAKWIADALAHNTSLQTLDLR